MRTYTLKPRGQEQTAIVQSRGAVIAEVYTDREPGDQHRTAALFATAPDMLAMLEKLTCAVERLPAASPLDGLAEDARAVISRAKGEE